MRHHEFLDNLERSARGTKTQITKKGPQDLLPYIVAHRGEHPVALVTVRRHDRHEILRTAGFLAAALDADNIGVVYECYEPARGPEPGAGINPMTNRVWEQGEMNDAVKNHDAIGKGWIHEAINLSVVNRAGDFAMRVVPFKYVANRHLYWLDEQSWSTIDHPDGENTGYFPETMINFMLKPSMDQVARFVNLDRDERDLAAVQFLVQNTGATVKMFSLADDHKRQRTIGDAGGTWVAQ
jgi:hypothetical protein